MLLTRLSGLDFVALLPRALDLLKLRQWLLVGAMNDWPWWKLMSPRLCQARHLAHFGGSARIYEAVFEFWPVPAAAHSIALSIV